MYAGIILLVVVLASVEAAVSQCKNRDKISINAKKYLVDVKGGWKVIQSTKPAEESCLYFYYFVGRDKDPNVGTAVYRMKTTTDDMHMVKISKTTPEETSWECSHNSEPTVTYYASFFDMKNPNAFCLYTCDEAADKVTSVRCFSKNDAGNEAVKKEIENAFYQDIGLMPTWTSNCM